MVVRGALLIEVEGTTVVIVSMREIVDPAGISEGRGNEDLTYQG
jgi:hypothetical protein